jgi:hypothetical protein
MIKVLVEPTGLFFCMIPSGVFFSTAFLITRLLFPLVYDTAMDEHSVYTEWITISSSTWRVVQFVTGLGREKDTKCSR